MNALGPATWTLGIALLSMPARADSGKKLIEYGWDRPNTSTYRQRVRDMEKVGFDGVVIAVEVPGQPGQDLGWKVFSTERFDPDWVEPAIADLQAARSDVLTDNFIAVQSYKGVEWFAPQWDSVCANVALMARVAKQGGCKGIMFDAEEYGKYNALWTYDAFAPEQKAAHTFDECRAQARRRGREFIQAIQAEFPDIALLLLWGPSRTYERALKEPREKARYSLLADFCDGICEAGAPGITLIDGCEQTYGFRARAQFAKERQAVLQGAAEFSAVPEAYRAHIRAGMSIWMDRWSTYVGWNTTVFEKNYFTPAEFRNSAAYALEAADEYVWIYSERLNWWTGEHLPGPYLEALRRAKAGPGPDIPERKFALPPRAARIPGYSDAETFASYRESMDEALDLPKENWRFAQDEKDAGEREQWFAAEHDDSKWAPIGIGEFWEYELERMFDGIGWYRRTIDVPSLPAGRRVFLVAGAADEAAWVWVNGKLAGSHDVGEQGWDKSFSLDVTDFIQPGQPNVLAIRVRDATGMGGLWKSIKLMVAKER